MTGNKLCKEEGLVYSKVLVPLDGMEIAECILGHVREIVTGCQVSEVVLLTVVEPY